MENTVMFIVTFIISYSSCRLMFWLGQVHMKYELRRKLEEINMNQEITYKEYEIIDVFLENN